jgi:hypothetical protein
VADLEKLMFYPDSREIRTVALTLYCWQHNANHMLKLADLERLVYALSAAVSDAYGIGADDPALGREFAALPSCCLLDVVKDWAGDPDMYADHVEQGVACRQAGDEVRP